MTAGEPLKLLEERAGLPVAQVTDIMRQSGNYKNVAKALSEGKTGAAFEELDKLKWIRQVPDDERYQLLADAYLSAAREQGKDGKPKTALVVSPTHAEAARVTDAIRTARKAAGELAGERVVTAYVAAHLTDAQKADSTEYQPGDMLQFFQNAPGHTKGDRIMIDESSTPPVGLAQRFEVYRAKPLPLAVGDRIRVTAGGTTKDGKHRLSNGSLFTVNGFTPQGDIKVNNGWVIDHEFGHLAHGYVTTSHASQGTTVNKVFIAIDSESMKATDQRTAYVAITRGTEQALIFTDDHLALLKAVQRESDGLSATELAEQTSPTKPAPAKAFANRRLGVRHSVMEQAPTASGRTPSQEREHDHAR